MDRALRDKLTVLRERTQAGLSDCRVALDLARGNVDDAVDLVCADTRNLNVDRFLFRAQVHTAVSADGRVAVLIEIAGPHRPRDHEEAPAPFVAGVLAAAERAPLGADLSALPLGEGTVGAAAASVSASIGLPVAVRRWTRIELAKAEHGRLAARTDHRRELGCVVAVTAPTATVAAHPATQAFTDELADRILHRRPAAIRRAGVDPALVAAEQAKITRLAQWDDPEGTWTPEDAARHDERQLERFFTWRVLLEQPWRELRWNVAPGGGTVDEQRRAAGAEAGGDLHVARFAWFERGDRMVDTGA